MADRYDFQIDSLKFRLATSDKFPYIRSTADFRKDQLDTSATVGDQSLTGWWTRGQLSFHMGAGLNYYEVLEGESVLNRFKDSQNVRTFVTPGEATLDISPAVIASDVELDSIATYRTHGLVWTNGFDAKYRSTPGAATSNILTNDTTPALFVTSVGDYIYIATFGKKIESFYNTGYVSTSYSHTAAFRGLWGGKDRLWIVDETGAVYAVAPQPAAPPVALSSPICTVDYISGNPVSFTDGGGAVFMSVGTEQVYAFVPGTNGAVATMTAPVVAAILPRHEKVQSIRAHMGLLCLVTNKGVRFAAIAASNLTVGPLSVAWYDSNCLHIGIQGNSVFVTGNDTSFNTYGYEFCLTEPLPSNSLAFPYRKAWFYNTGGQSTVPPSLVCEHSTDGIAWASGGNTADTFVTTAGQTTLSATGDILTAQHRFGTLDPKRFYRITVRASGTGTIQVYKVSAAGVETSLGTMNASAGQAEFALNESSAVERMAFKFLLSRDSGNTDLGPTLLGYQIKALPVPERQRLLRVPLLVVDNPRLRHGVNVGTRGKAYSDLTTLEQLEKNTAIVTFTDHRTGETGAAYIDKVDFQGDKPTTANDNGFGGVAYVTLRVLA